MRALLDATLPVLGVAMIVAFNVFTGFRSEARVPGRDPKKTSRDLPIGGAASTVNPSENPETAVG
jgi:hypothetical protein